MFVVFSLTGTLNINRGSKGLNTYNKDNLQECTSKMQMHMKDKNEATSFRVCWKDMPSEVTPKEKRQLRARSGIAWPSKLQSSITREKRSLWSSCFLSVYQEYKS